MKISWPMVIVSITAVSALAWVLGQGFGRNPHEVPFMLTNKPAPDFSLERVDAAGTLSLKALHGKPVVLNFWSTWCDPCKAEHPNLEWGQEKFGEKVQFVGVVYHDKRENVVAFLKHTPARWPMLFDEVGRSAVDYGLAGVPETYFITKDGTIHHKHVGPIDRGRLQLYISELLQ